jgi:hypothetical protein
MTLSAILREGREKKKVADNDSSLVRDDADPILALNGSLSLIVPSPPVKPVDSP